MDVSTDFLSLCPCLIDILQYMTITEQGNCQLVNRRLRDIITSNPIALKPTSGVLTFSRTVTRTVENIYIFIDTAGRQHLALMTDKMILLTNCKGNSCNYFDKIGFQGVECIKSVFSPDSSEGILIEKLKMKRSFNKLDSYRLYHSDSFLEGFRRVLESLAKSQHWDEIWLKNNLPASCVDLVTEVFQQNRSRCRTLRAPMSSAALRYVAAIGCRRVILQLFASDDDVIDDFLDVFSRQRKMKITVCSRQNLTKTLLFPLLQNWQTGKFSMNKMLLRVSLYSENFPVGWIDVLIGDLTLSLKHSTVAQETSTAEENWRKIAITRRVDNRTVTLTFCLRTYIGIDIDLN